MGFKEVTSLDADTTVAIGGSNRKTGKKNPTSAEGYYLGTRMVDSPKSKSGKAAIHFLQTSKGNLGVWGKTDMDKKFSQITPGVMVRVSFDKMVSTPNGDMYKYKLEVDKENTIDVGDLTGGASFGSDDEGTEETETYGGNDDDGGDDVGGEEEDEETLQAAAEAAAAKKRRVQELLNKRK